MMPGGRLAPSFRMILIDAANALAVQVRGRRADDFDPVDDFGRDAVDEHDAVVAAARNRPAVDQDLGESGAKAAQGGRIIFADVAAERDARNALQRVADRRRLELLEEFLAEGQFRRDRVRSVAVDPSDPRRRFRSSVPVVVGSRPSLVGTAGSPAALASPSAAVSAAGSWSGARLVRRLLCRIAACAANKADENRSACRTCSCASFASPSSPCLLVSDRLIR